MDLMEWYQPRWERSPQLPAYTCLSSAVVAELLELSETVVATGGRPLSGVPLYHCSPAALSVLTGTDSLPLRAADAGASGPFVAQSPIHDLGVFAAPLLLPGARILPFYGQIVFDDLEVAARTHGADTSAHRSGYLLLSL